MLKGIRIAVAMSVVAITAISHPAFSEPQQVQYGFPIISPEVDTGDLPCYLTTSNTRTLDLGRLCGGTIQTPNFQSSSRGRVVRRIRVANGQYFSQYESLAETYPDANVRALLSARMSDPESVCRRLEEGQTVEQIRTEDIASLQPSGNIVRDNARKQNIEIRLKLAPQYYCPENPGPETGNRSIGSDFGGEQPIRNSSNDNFTPTNLEPSRVAPSRNLEPSRLGGSSSNLEPSRLAPTPSLSISNP